MNPTMEVHYGSPNCHGFNDPMLDVLFPLCPPHFPTTLTKKNKVLIMISIGLSSIFLSNKMVPVTSIPKCWGSSSNF